MIEKFLMREMSMGGFEGDSTPEKGVKAHFRDYRFREPKRVNSRGEKRLALVTS